VAHIGEEFRLGLVGFLGAAFLFGIFLREIRKFLGLLFERRLRALEIDDIGRQPQIVVHQPLLVALDLGDVGADRHEAAVLGAPLADVQPASVVELRLEGARTRRGGLGVGDASPDFRHVADLDDRLVGRADGDGGIRQLVQALEMRIAQHQPVLRIPEHECFRDRLDGVPQPHVRFDRARGEALLLGDVERDADQVTAAIAAGLGQFAAHAQPDPVTIGMAHAEGLVDMAHLARQQAIGNRHQVDILGVHQRIDLAEGEKVVAALQSQHREHRLRPEDASARQVPVPQSAAAAIERGVDASADGVVDEVAFTRACRLPVKGETKDQHHEAGGCRQRDQQCRVGTP